MYLKNVLIRDLSYNPIRYLNNYDFSSLNYLEALYLDGCGLQDIDSVDWKQLVSLKELGLRDNHITNIGKVLKESWSIRSLDLRLNRISHLPSKLPDFITQFIVAVRN